RNGIPHSMMNVDPANGVVKCDQNASLVPGCDHAARNPTLVSIAEVTTLMAPVSVFTDTSRGKCGGWLRTMSHTRIVNRTPTAAKLANVNVHDVRCSRATTGMTATICPS